MEIDVLLWSWLNDCIESYDFAFRRRRRKKPMNNKRTHTHNPWINSSCAWMQNAHTCICVSFCWAHKLVSYLISFSLFLFKQFIAYFFNDVSVDGFFRSIGFYFSYSLPRSLDPYLSLIQLYLLLWQHSIKTYFYFSGHYAFFLSNILPSKHINRPFIVDLFNVVMRWSSHLAYKNDDLCVWYLVDPF